MNQVIVPDGITIDMSEDIFLQDPKLFMNSALGMMVNMRVFEGEEERLEGVFGRQFIKDILAKDTYTWQDYCNIMDWCL